MNAKLKIERTPEGLLVDRAWLKKHEINGPLVDYYVRKGYLEALARGVYRKPGPSLKWQHLVYSLQELGYPVHVGGRSALEWQGLSHYLPLAEKQSIHLFCDKKLPNWLGKIEIPVKFFKHSCLLFRDGVKDKGLTTIPFGGWDWPINIASPERAVLEMLAGVPRQESFHMAQVMMESAVNLRPDLVTILLEGCRNIKVKRLFLWLAEQYQHQWVKRLDLKKVHLGSGKRVIQKGGKLDAKYLITVPREDADGQEQALF